MTAKKQADVRRQAEGMMAGRRPAGPPLNADDLVNLVHELEINHLELEIQNEELLSIQNQLETSRDRYADLYDNAPVGYFSIDLLTNQVLEANLTAADILKCSRANLRRSRFVRFIEPDLVGIFHICLRKAREEPFKSTCEVKMRRADGSSFWASLELRGAPEGAQARVALLDITRRKEIESELRIKDYAIASSVAGIAFIDLSGNVTYVNPALERMGGYPASRVIGRTARLFFADPTTGDEALRTALELGSWQGELGIRRMDGSTIITQAAANLVRDERGRPVCLMASVWDITKRKRAEQIKDEFIGLVSHELRTPLTVIMGAVRVALSEGLSTEEIRELLREAAQSSDNLAHILDNLIELSRYQSDRLTLNTERTDVRRAVRDILRAEAGSTAHHKVVFECEEGLPEVEIDQIRLRQILRNLVNNAAKYSPPHTEIIVSVQRDGGDIVVGVSDKGKGISPEEQERLFQPFQRLGEARSEGLGLGLLVCRRLVEAHGGRVWVESEPGRGSTFRFNLPLKPETDAAA
jgi:PAS domain S-box-containing protein